MTSYGDLARAASGDLAVRLDLARRATASGLVTRETALRCAREAARETVTALDDHALLGAFASRTDLLDPDETAPPAASPRHALRDALAVALARDMDGEASMAVLVGHGPDTLPDSLASAVRAMEELDAAGIRYMLLDRFEALRAFDQEDAACRALATHACAFLEGHGRAGEANDLISALDGLDLAAMEPSPSPGPR